MPKVGGKKFAYTKKGKAAAKRHAKKTGKKAVKETKKIIKNKWVWIGIVAVLVIGYFSGVLTPADVPTPEVDAG